MNAKNLLAALSFLFGAVTAGAAELTPLENLGKNLFFDLSLSDPPGQSCASCHDPAVGWTGPDSSVNAAGAVQPGAEPTRTGNRKPPTVAYAGFHPTLHQESGMGGMGGMGGGMGGGGMMEGYFAGGLFYDGRATGWSLGDPLAEQAMGPFLNPLEQNNPDAQSVCSSVLRGAYARLFEDVWGPGSLDCGNGVEGSYQRIARSIAAYQRSTEVSAFSSKFDAFWRRSAGSMPAVSAINMMNWTKFKGRGLDDTELKGLMLFNTKGRCSTCHLLQPMNGSQLPLFTDFKYHNLGIPKNPLNPFYHMPEKWNPAGEKWIDLGLGGFLATTAGMIDHTGASRDYTAAAAKNLGKQKTPTLRNVDKRPAQEFVKAYGHNGHFKSLQDIVHFYNKRDVLPVCTGPNPPKDPTGAATCFPPPEVAENVNRMNTGNLNLTASEETALVQFLKTLSDGYQAQTKK